MAHRSAPSFPPDEATYFRHSPLGTRACGMFSFEILSECPRMNQKIPSSGDANSWLRVPRPLSL